MTDDIRTLIQELCEASPEQSDAAEQALCALGTRAVHELLPLLSDPTGPGRLRALSCLGAIGSEAVPVLQRIRREGPGQLRRPALEALGDLAGGQALEERDLRAVDRLVRIKLIDERSEDLPIGRWIAVNTGQVDDIVSALGLHHTRPATVEMGICAAVEFENSVEFHRIDQPMEHAYRVFITPQFDGWRLIYGDDFINDHWAWAVEKLSSRGKQAHFYLVDDFDGANVWWVAQNGSDRRGYRTYGDPQWVGEPMDFERSLMVDEDDPLYDAAEHADYAEGVTDPESVASWISIPPNTVSIAERSDHGWLAVTHQEVPHERFKGALRI
ncbi:MULTISPECIES: HEAT repeat domain-containing protein [Streptomyces]|uniref:HEAT repeat domain-containing protein n=1 Tax=Streptomyces siderophoricus TaxID=2802281 RepID=A0ABS1MRY9_9ACTN|nr:hypothetical protein [Streptomyces sp. 9-7]MBL1090503.1 hypothetical protein [Streptomyces sp. 9-7]